ncbi:inorganic phosphate transporter [Aeromonas simiae]|uniref:Phosphate transporter n=1 Tax=Aeromonas simiae TaxID=218936 RepID=A0A5J6WV38_9GAMM|nr:inorganic phosphate transporter [Aeromonas simiae]QFI54660.1 inorganic phosphate transporter [Aeromonas simiae]
MFAIFEGMNLWLALGLVLSVVFVLAYEFINGFHDTANAVATVIYTKAMPAHIAVVSSGIFNFFGVMFGGLGVAYAIVHLLPIDLLLGMDSRQGLVMIFSLLFSAIAWNLGTWYLGIPASSSHTLIGSILGVGGAYAWLVHKPLNEGINISKAIDIMLSLIVSPTVGFILAALLLFVMKKIWTGHKIHKTPEERLKVDGKKHPPFWARLTLVASAMGVSFVHGSNDGQKGIGLLMLVLICMAPAHFALNMSSSAYHLDRTQDAANRIAELYWRNQEQVKQVVDFSKEGKSSPELMEHCTAGDALPNIATLDNRLGKARTYADMSLEDRREVRRLLLCIDDTAKKVSKLPLPAKELSDLAIWRKDLIATAEYAPTWVIVSIALALGCGTMVGWRRIVHTVGEKIGSKGMTYSQGIAAQITAASAIGVASVTGMPVSTTHVLSSAVAGTMVANRSGLQTQTIKTILMAWILTLPLTMALSAGLFLAAHALFA